MKFSEILETVRNSHLDSVNIPEKWGQGRATFGGLVAAVLYEKLSQSLSQPRPVQSIMVSFVAPVAPGKLDIETIILREGKSAIQVQCSASQDGKVAAVMLASFGSSRESGVSVLPELASEFNAPQQANEFPFVPGLTPDFTQYFDYRYTQGKLPFMGSKDTDMGGWIKLREPSLEVAGVPEILALLDAWPPAVFTMLKKPASFSSLTWTVSFVEQPEDCKANDWWQYQANIESSNHGYSHIDASLWDKNGRVAVISRQTVSVFA